MLFLKSVLEFEKVLNLRGESILKVMNVRRIERETYEFRLNFVLIHLNVCAEDRDKMRMHLKI